MRNRSRFGWLEFLTGVALIVLGVSALIRPGSLITSTVIVCGAVVAITGVSDLVFYIRTTHEIGFGPTVSLISGLLSVLVGVSLIVYPDAVTWILTLLVPIWFISHCINRLSLLNVIRFTAGSFLYWFTLIVNALGLILGVVMLFRPGFTTATLGILGGIYCIALGVDSVLTAFSGLGGSDCDLL